MFFVYKGKSAIEIYKDNRKREVDDRVPLLAAPVNLSGQFGLVAFPASFFKPPPFGWYEI